MSIFSSLMKDFNEDPFFSGPMENMRRMESIMNSMSPFGAMGGMFAPMGYQNALPEPNASRPQDNRNLMPFGFGRSLFPNMNMFADFDRLAQNPNCHSYSSSSVMTYTTDETGRPQVYQASASTRTAPGGVKETRRTVQDSRTGLQKMAIGHHLEDKAHVLEKVKNKYTGDEEENHEFVNLEDEEAENFDNEWQQKAQTFSSRPMHSALNAGVRRKERCPPERQEVLAITEGPRDNSYSSSRHHGAGGKSQSSGQKHKRKHGSSSGHKSGHSYGRPTPYE